MQLPHKSTGRGKSVQRGKNVVQGQNVGERHVAMTHLNAEGTLGLPQFGCPSQIYLPPLHGGRHNASYNAAKFVCNAFLMQCILYVRDAAVAYK